MVILSRPPLACATPPRAAASRQAATDRYERGDDDEGLTRGQVLQFAATLLGAGAGAYAGLANGCLAGVLGGASAALPGAVAGSIAFSALGEKVFHTSESATAGLAIAGGLAGLAGGALTGYLLGSRLNSPVLAGALGLLGATSAFVSRMGKD